MEKIVDFKVREKALDTIRKNNAEDLIQKWQEIFNNCSKMTAGVAFNAGNVHLGVEKVHERVWTHNNNQQQKILDSERKKKEDLAKLQSKMDAIQQKTSDPTKWNASQLQTIVSWFKRPGDSKLLQCKEEKTHNWLF